MVTLSCAEVDASSCLTATLALLVVALAASDADASAMRTAFTVVALLACSVADASLTTLAEADTEHDALTVPASCLTTNALVTTAELFSTIASVSAILSGVPDTEDDATMPAPDR